MNIEITILGTEKAFNIWTLATATVNGNRFQIQMVFIADHFIPYIICSRFIKTGCNA